MMTMAISSFVWGASVEGGDEVKKWTERLTFWSTDALPSLTFPDLEDTEIQIAAEVLSKNLSDLQNLSDDKIAAFPLDVAHCFFEVACIEPEKTRLSFEFRETLVKMAEKRTPHLTFEYWADILGETNGKEEEELLYAAKAAKDGHEESKHFLQERAERGSKRAKKLIQEYDLLDSEDE